MFGKKLLVAVGFAAAAGIAGMGAAANGGGATMNLPPTANWSLKSLNNSYILYVDVMDANGAADLDRVAFQFTFKDGTTHQNGYAERLVQGKRLIVSDIDRGRRYRFMPIPAGLSRLLLIAKDKAAHELRSEYQVPVFVEGGGGVKPAPKGGGTTKGR